MHNRQLLKQLMSRKQTRSNILSKMEMIPVGDFRGLQGGSIQWQIHFQRKLNQMMISIGLRGKELKSMATNIAKQPPKYST